MKRETFFRRLYLDVAEQQAIALKALTDATRPIEIDGMRARVIGLVLGTDETTVPPRTYALIHYREYND